MRIIVGDIRSVIDLQRAALLQDMLRLPYTFVMPSPLFNDAWMSLSTPEKARLRALGLETRDLPGPMVKRAAAYFNRHRRLKLNGCFALVLAQETEQAVLLTCDVLLRRIAEENDVQARDVLWVTDELEAHKVVPPALLHRALCLLRDDDLVLLPEDELARRIRRVGKLL